MAHKNLIGGTAYDTKGGRGLVDGTGYDIKKGRTLVGGTGYDVVFSQPCTVKITTLKNGASTDASSAYGSVTINGTKYTEAATLEIKAGETLTFSVRGRIGTGGLYEYGSVWINGTLLIRCSTSNYTEFTSGSWTVPTGISNITIQLNTKEYNGFCCRIEVKTS